MAIRPITLKPSHKLNLLVFFMSAFIIGIGAYGLVELRTMNEKNQSLYADGVVHMNELINIRLSMLTGIISPLQQVQTQQRSYTTAVKQISAAEETMDANWQAYLHSHLSADEVVLANQISMLMKHSGSVVAKLKTVLDRNEPHTLDSVINYEFYPAINPVIARMSALLDLQVKEGAEEYQESTAAYHTALIKFALLILLSLAFAIPFTIGLVRRVSQLINKLDEGNKTIALFIEHSPAALAMFDRDMRYIAASRQWASANNIPQQNLVGKLHYDLFPNIQQSWKDVHQRCLQGAIEKRDEEKLVREDGTEDWIRWEVNPWRKTDGETGGIIMFAEVITERKKATELFRRQFENSPDMILIINRKFIIESMNRGVPGSLPLSEVIGADCIEVLPPESREPTRNAIMRCFETSQNQEVEVVLRLGNWVRTRFVPIMYNDGIVTQIMAIATDISEHKIAEKKIIESEAKLKEAQAIAHIGNWEIDLLNNTHKWSDELFNIFDISRSGAEPSIELLLQLMHPDDVHNAKKNIREALATHTNAAADFRLMRKDKSLGYAHIEWRFEFDKNQRAIRVYGTVQDVTERKATEKKIKQSEANYRQMFDLSPAPMWVFDEQTNKILQVNQASITHYGYTAEEFADMSIEDIIADPGRKDNRHTVGKKHLAIANFMGGGRHAKKSGEIIDVVTSSIPIVLNGKTRVLFVAIDVTEKNLYEEKLSLAAIKAQEDERYEIGSELHDNVCQILATSLITLGMIRAKLPDDSRDFFDQTHRYISMASDEIRNLSHRLAPAFFDDLTLEDAFKDLLHSFNIDKKYQVNLSFNKRAKTYPLNHDLQLSLYRILQEQLRNISKYAAASVIEIEVIIEDNSLQMRVTDNGVGLDIDNIKGGIGLANMNRRARLFYGSLTIDSAIGEGCEIRIIIPLSGAN